MSSFPELNPTLAAPDDDPWLKLEDVEAPRALAWMDKQNAGTLSRLADARFAANRDALKAALDRPDNLPLVTRCGSFLYNFWPVAGQPRGVWRRTTLASYLNPGPDWDVLPDLDALAQAEAEQGPGLLPR